jgi:restriction endonuclease S subunit
MVELGKVCEIYNGSTPKRTDNSYWDKGTIPWFTIDDIREQGRIIKYTKQEITKSGFENSSVKLLPKNTVLLCCTASVGEYAYTEIELTTNQQFNGLVVNNNYQDKLNPKFLFYLSSTFKSELERLSGKTSFNFVSVGILKSIKIPLPPLEIQKQIVTQIEEEQKAVEACKNLIEINEQKIKSKISEVWSEE